MASNARVKLGLTNLSATELVAKAQGVHDAMTGNAHFATPVPTMPVLQTAIDALSAANAAVANNRGRAEYRERRTTEIEVRGLLKQLGAYVQMTSGGDPEIIESSSFAVVKRGSPIGELPPPRNLGSRFTTMSGRVALKWDREDGAEMHHVFMSTSSDPFNWVLIGATSKSRFNVDSLEPGTIYWFAVTAIGAAGETSKSDVLLARAA